MNDKITYITEDKKELLIAEQSLKKLGIEIIPKKINYSKIQSDNENDILKESISVLKKKIDGNIVITSINIEISSLSGFPGPYTNYVESIINNETINRLIKGNKDSELFYVGRLALKRDKRKVKIFTSKIKSKNAILNIADDKKIREKIYRNLFKQLSNYLKQ